MKAAFWKASFALLETLPFFSKIAQGDRYKRFKSVKLPGTVVYRGLRTTIDSQLKLDEECFKIPNQHILFFKLKSHSDTLFEIKETLIQGNHKYYLVFHPISGNEFYLSEKTFNILFYSYRKPMLNLNHFFNQAK